MKIPKGMTAFEVLAVINKIVIDMRTNLIWLPRTDDIRQEAFIIAVDALNRYQEGRPLENF